MKMHKIEQATFTHEIEQNVQRRDILILKNKKHPATVIKVYIIRYRIWQEENIMKSYTEYTSSCDNSANIQSYSTKTLTDVGTLQLSVSYSCR
jgi:hypothetical protein